MDRRTLLRAGLVSAGATVLAACTGDNAESGVFVAPDGDEVRAAEVRRNPGDGR